MRFISKSTPVARKNYGCDASIWIHEYPESVDDCEMSFADKRTVVKMRKNGWRIMKGEKHKQQTVISCDGDMISLRASIPILEILYKYDLMPEDEAC